MDTLKLRLLVETVNAKSINKAAEKTGHTQPGLTYNLNSIEGELGIKILSRTHSGIALTEDGEAVFPIIRGIIEQEDALRSVAEELRRAKKGKELIRIGSYSSIAQSWLPDILRGFTAKNPNVNLNIRVGGPRILQWLEDDEIDLALVDGGIAASYKWQYICDDEMNVAFPASSPLSKFERITADMLKDLPIIFPSLNVKSSVMKRLNSAGISESDVKISMSSEDASGLLSMVEGGLGITFVTGMYRRQCPSTVCMRPLDPPLTRQIGYIVNEKHCGSKILMRLIKMIESAEKQI